jgi:hypothetical protein
MNMPVIIPDIDDDDLSICSQTDNSAVPQHAYLVYGDIDAERPVAECGYHTHDLRTDPPSSSSSLSRSPQDTAQAQSPEAMTPFGQQCELVQDYVYPLQDHPTEIIDILCQMKRSPQCEAIQARGCEGLWVHSWDDHASDAIGEVGGIPTLLDAMFHFPKNAQLQRSACEAIQNLALNVYNRSILVDKGGAALLVHAMMLHLDSIAIQQCGCMALASLASSSDFHTDIIRAGGAHAIIHAARRFPDERTVQYGAFIALEAFGCDPRRYIP